MKTSISASERTLQKCVFATGFAAIGLAGCGGGDTGTNSPVAHQSVAAPVNAVRITPPDATFAGRTYAQWAAEFWQWAFRLPATSSSSIPHPFDDCNARPISADQTGNVWFWAAPDSVETCNQSNTVIPAGKTIFLTMLDVEASSLESSPFHGATEAEQRAIAEKFFSRIDNVFCTIDGVPVDNISSYRAETAQFRFYAPSPWVFGHVGGKGTSVGKGYFVMLKLPPGSHTIHYGGRFHLQRNDLDADSPAQDIVKDITLLVTIGG